MSRKKARIDSKQENLFYNIRENYGIDTSMLEILGRFGAIHSQEQRLGQMFLLRLKNIFSHNPDAIIHAIAEKETPLEILADLYSSDKVNAKPNTIYLESDNYDYTRKAITHLGYIEGHMSIIRNDAELSEEYDFFHHKIGGLSKALEDVPESSKDDWVENRTMGWKPYQFIYKDVENKEPGDHLRRVEDLSKEIMMIIENIYARNNEPMRLHRKYKQLSEQLAL